VLLVKKGGEFYGKGDARAAKRVKIKQKAAARRSIRKMRLF